MDTRSNYLTILFGSDRYWWRCGTFAPLRSSRQPHVIQRVRIQSRQRVRFGHRYTSVVLFVRISVIPIQFVIHYTFT